MSKIRQYGFIPGLIIFLGLSAFYGWNWYMEARLHQAVRVHFIANSDRPDDQKLKLQVRDAVLQQLTPGIKATADREQAVAYLTSHLVDVEQMASQEVRQQGYAYPVQAAIGESNFGWRTNGGIIFSPGNYTALTVTIGQGQGHNWWGVIYPPFCLVSKENNHPGMQVRCKLWDLAGEFKGQLVTRE